MGGDESCGRARRARRHALLAQRSTACLVTTRPRTDGHSPTSRASSCAAAARRRAALRRRRSCSAMKRIRATTSADRRSASRSCSDRNRRNAAGRAIAAGAGAMSANGTGSEARLRHRAKKERVSKGARVWRNDSTTQPVCTDPAASARQHATACRKRARRARWSRGATIAERPRAAADRRASSAQAEPSAWPQCHSEPTRINAASSRPCRTRCRHCLNRFRRRRPVARVLAVAAQPERVTRTRRAARHRAKPTSWVRRSVAAATSAVRRRAATLCARSTRSTCRPTAAPVPRHAMPQRDLNARPVASARHCWSM
eukprot:scaffold17436_cov112-Isochrysis_galbana.AAC.5